MVPASASKARRPVDRAHTEWLSVYARRMEGSSPVVSSMLKPEAVKVSSDAVTVSIR